MKRIPHQAGYAGLAAAGLLTLAFGLSAPREREAAVAGGAAVVAESATAAATGVRLSGLGAEWDLPNVDHPRVDYWLARFDTVPAMRKKFEGFLERGGQYAPMILDRLEARGMPLDLLYLAMIESGFQANAQSHAAAVGLWQFIRETGERYGLAVDRAVDERRDPLKATDAALDYLEELHKRFDSWYLAAAAYNSGENRVARLMRAQFGTERARSEQDYYAIWDRLPAETRDYVPLMIAAGRITKDPAKYGFSPMSPETRTWEEITAAPATQLDELARMYGTTVSAIRSLNPQLLIGRTPNDRAYTLRVPVGSLAHFAQAQGDDRSFAD
jgi:membrane-bound lytic murein transglycosylase D